MKESLKERINRYKTLKNDTTWGLYYLGQFYFTIKTHKNQSDLGLDFTNKTGISDFKQKELQKNNLPAIFHEYIHYLHEVSTVIGNIGLGLELVLKTDFTNLLNAEKEFIYFNGYETGNNELKDRLEKVLITQEYIFGSDKVSIKQILSINSKNDFIFIPYGNDFCDLELNLPIITIIDIFNNESKITLGKFYLYEGIAYELDRMVDKQFYNKPSIDDYHYCSEYTVIRQIAKFISPNTSTRDFLTIASLSLSYLNCGEMFIYFLKDFESKIILGFENAQILLDYKQKTAKILSSKLTEFNEAQDEYLKIFEKRQRIYKGMEYLIKINKLGYKTRIDNPTFEIDMVFEGKFNEIINIIPICDFIYLFEDKISFQRDFLGSILNEDVSQALKTLICNTHFYSIHFTDSTQIVKADPSKKDEKKCPFYFCCNLSLRENNDSLCKKEPWEVYRLSFNTDKQYCWYGQGILELKGTNLP